MPTKYAAYFAVNTYRNPENNLRGCHNDLYDWCKLVLEKLGISTSMFFDSQAPKSAMVSTLVRFVEQARPGDHIVWGYSGHGTYLRDRSGDEEDMFDEALVPYDYDSVGPLIDDELRSILDNVRSGVGVTMILDCCFAGPDLRLAGVIPGAYRKPRFITIEKDLLHASVPPGSLRRIGRAANPNEVWFAASKEDLPAFDAHISGDYHGAFSYYATRAWLPILSNAQFFDKINHVFPHREYPQYPHLEGGEYSRKLITFSDITADLVEPEPPKKPWWKRLFCCS